MDEQCHEGCSFWLPAGRRRCAGSRSHGTKGSPCPTAPTGFPRCASEDPCHSVSWLLLGFCWQCCTCKCFLFLPEPLKGCQPMPWLNGWVEADTWDVVTSSRRDSNCLSPLKPEQKGASLAFLWNLGIWLLHCKDRNSCFWKAGPIFCRHELSHHLFSKTLRTFPSKGHSQGKSHFSH